MRPGRVAVNIAILGAILSALIAACSAFSADPAEVPAPAEGGDERVVVDPEAGADVQDGGADAPAEAEQLPFCDTVDAQLCWSFDEPPFLVGTRFTIDTNTTAPTVVDAGLSPPNAMSVPLRNPGYSGLRFDVGGVVKYIRCDFDVLFARVEPNSDAGAFSFAQLDYTNSNFFVPGLGATKVDPMAVSATLGVGGFPPVVLGNVVIGVWTHVFIDTEIVGGKWIMRAEVVKDTPKTLDLGARLQLPEFSKIFWGVATVAALTDTEVRFDNVTCAWR